MLNLNYNYFFRNNLFYTVESYFIEIISRLHYKKKEVEKFKK